MRESNKYSIAELAQITGTSVRTIRYYIQQGIAFPPEGKGRGAYYTEHHLNRILEILALKNEALGLDQIKRNLEGNLKNSPEENRYSPTRELVTRITLAEGIRLELDSHIKPPNPGLLNKIAVLCQKHLKPTNPAKKSSKYTVTNLTGGKLMIPDGQGPGKTLRLATGESLDIDELTAAIEKARYSGLVAIEKSES